MKLLYLDSRLDARMDLAKELNYTGGTSDSASLNVWLHKQVRAKLAAARCSTIKDESIGR